MPRIANPVRAVRLRLAPPSFPLRPTAPALAPLSGTGCPQQFQCSQVPLAAITGVQDLLAQEGHVRDPFKQGQTRQKLHGIRGPEELVHVPRRGIQHRLYELLQARPQDGMRRKGLSLRAVGERVASNDQMSSSGISLDQIGLIRRLKGRHGERDREIAGITGLSRNTVAKWLSGRPPIDSSTSRPSKAAHMATPIWDPPSREGFKRQASR